MTQISETRASLCCDKVLAGEISRGVDIVSNTDSEKIYTKRDAPLSRDMTAIPFLQPLLQLLLCLHGPNEILMNDGSSLVLRYMSPLTENILA